jgi:CubicO group peptidase (beta-lactamase class C family)
MTRVAVAKVADPLAGLDDYVRKSMAEWNMVGLSIAIVKNDSVVYAKGFGLRELGKPDSVTPRTLFAIGSNTKSFTSAAIGMLVDEGKMSWDDKVTKWLPGFQLYDPYVTRELTMRDILSHRSGLGRRGDMLWIAAHYPRAEILRRMRFLEPNAGFRTEMGYNNMMFLAAGEAAAAASGMSWDDLITTRILRPLGMVTTTTTVKDLPSRPDVAAPHGMRDKQLVTVPRRDLDNIAPAGSIFSSAEEMTHYLRLILGGGKYEGKTLLKAGSLATIHTPHVSMFTPPDTLRPSTHFTAYGLGWVLTDYLGRKIAWHNGGIDGYLSEMWTVPEEKLGVVILTNRDGHALGSALVERILDAYLGGTTRDWSAITLARIKDAQAAQEAQRKQFEAARVKDSKPTHPLEAYAGTYADSMYGDLKVTVSGDHLVVSYGVGGLTGDLSHWHFDTFQSKWSDSQLGTAMVTFGLDKDGKPVSATVEGTATFKRK